MAPLRVFSVFLGIIVLFDYLLCIAIVFPAICLYDQWKEKGNVCWFVTFGSPSSRLPTPSLDGRGSEDLCHGDTVDEHTIDEGNREVPDVFIMRVLMRYYKILHHSRYVLLVFFGAGFIVSIFYALQLSLPKTSSVRQLPPSHETELNFKWRADLLERSLLEQIGRQTQILWGVTPSDNGNHLNPHEGAALVLDESFDPSPSENQLYLQSFCRQLLMQTFVNPTTDDFVCPFDVFETWLETRTESNQESSMSCPSDVSFPVDPDFFHQCISEFLDSDTASENSVSSWIYQRNGTVTIIRLPYRQIGIRFDSGYDVLDEAWHLFDEYMTTQMATAPAGVNNAFGSSLDFWWYETNGKMLFTAYVGTAIALSAVFVVLLCSCRSLRVTCFAVITIADILLTVSMLLTLSGWTLGFLEAICFAILVGMSSDFVLHFSHAYCSPPGVVDRHIRTSRALLSMGPSILAAAITTIAAAIVLLFAQISFFRRFAVILLYTLTTGLVASMVLFFVLTDTFGPAEPTVLVDGLVAPKHASTTRNNDSGTASRTQESMEQALALETSTSSSEDQKPAVRKMEKIENAPPPLGTGATRMNEAPSRQMLASEEVSI